MRRDTGWLARGVALGTLGFIATGLGLVLGVRATRGAAADRPGTPTAPAHHAALSARTAAPSVPAAPAARNTQPATVPPYRPAGVQRITLDITEKRAEIAPGKVVTLWTFGDRSPGPIIRVRVGDRVEVTVHNKTALPHSIDMHAARIAPDRAFRDVAPGKSIAYAFRATSPGVFMYHCVTAPAALHLANGMYGMMIVEPAGGLPRVDRELGFVQSEFYPGSAPGASADNDKLMSKDPAVVTFNGYAGQYVDKPIAVRRGERIRIFLLDAGPNAWSAFHVVGSIFDRAWIDGIFPENLVRGGQTLNLSPSQGAVAEVRLDEEGTYPFVSHDFTSVAKGAVGLLRTANAPPTTMAH